MDSASDPVVRRASISDYLISAGSATVAELAERFNVSAMTVHRDLTVLERQLMIRRFRGGASAQPSSVFESSINYRRTAMRQEKAAIAEVAKNLIESGMSVMLDEGSTAFALAQAIHDISPLTVVTNHVETMVELRSCSDIRLIGIGGEYLPNHDAFAGLQCIEAIRELRADILFLSVSALNETATFHQEQEVILVKRALMEASARRILLVDSSKLGKTALHRLAPLLAFDLVITDDGAPPAALAEFDAQGISYMVAEVVKDTKR